MEHAWYLLLKLVKILICCFVEDILIKKKLKKIKKRRQRLPCMEMKASVIKLFVLYHLKSNTLQRNKT